VSPSGCSTNLTSWSSGLGPHWRQRGGLRHREDVRQPGAERAEAQSF
jgi:hypothetical protein